MSNLLKSQNGLLFYDDFSEKTLMWTLSPSYVNCLSFGEDGLRILHTTKYVTYTIIEPSIEEYSCIVELDHIPYNYQDIAGVIILSNTKEYAECQSYLATAPSELGNAEYYDRDIQGIIDSILNNYVQYSINEEESTPNDSLFKSNELMNKKEENSIVFIDTLYKYIRFNKNGYKYVFYASPDRNTWIEIGNVSFEDGGVIGFFLYAADTKEMIEHSHCYFKSFTLYKSRYLSINGIIRKYDLEILDENLNSIVRTDSIQYMHMINRSNKTCLINTTTLSIPVKNAKLRVYSKTNYETTIALYYLGDVYGGDEYTLTHNIGCYINNKKVNPNELYNLGIFYRGSYYIKMHVQNEDEDAIYQLKLKVIQYSEYYSGEQEISLALCQENQIESELEYKKELIIDEILPSEGKTIFLKLIDRPVQGFYKVANDYRFKILME